MSVSSNQASSSIEEAFNALKDMEAQFKMLSENSTRQWQDSKQKQFFGRYVDRYSNTINELPRETSSILGQVKSIENTLKSYR
jgi:thymidylate synthase